jgi:hypothetical protein
MGSLLLHVLLGFSVFCFLLPTQFINENLAPGVQICVTREAGVIGVCIASITGSTDKAVSQNVRLLGCIYKTCKNCDNCCCSKTSMHYKGLHRVCVLAVWANLLSSE